MMLFDPSLDALTEHRNELGLPLYFDKLRSPTNQLQVEETILHASYKFYLLIADVTKLSRLSRPLDSAEFIRWQSLEHELLRWSHFKSCPTDISLELCYLAIQILLHKINPNATATERSRRMRLFLKEGLQRVPALNVDSYPAGYMLWPAAILGAVAESFEERKIIRNFLALISDRKGGGQGAWVQKEWNGFGEPIADLYLKNPVFIGCSFCSTKGKIWWMYLICFNFKAQGKLTISLTSGW